MMSHPLHSQVQARLWPIIEWSWTVIAWNVASVRAIRLQAVNSNEWTAILMLVATGIGLLGRAIVTQILEAYRGWRNIDSESVQGRLARCNEEVKALRHAHDMNVERINLYHAAQCKEYEARLENKRAEIQWLHRQVEMLGRVNEQNHESILGLEATIVQQTQVISQLGQRSVANTTEAIRKIPKQRPSGVIDPDTDADLAVVVPEQTLDVKVGSSDEISRIIVPGGSPAS